MFGPGIQSTHSLEGQLYVGFIAGGEHAMFGECQQELLPASTNTQEGGVLVFF